MLNIFEYDKPTKIEFEPEEIFKIASQSIESEMIDLKMIENPNLDFSYRDKKLYDVYFSHMIKDPRSLRIKNIDKEVYFVIIAYTMFSAGLYAAGQKLENKIVSSFNESEMINFMINLCDEGAMKLGMNTACICEDSDNKLYLDTLIVRSSRKILKELSYNVVNDKDALRYALRAFYNAGIVYMNLRIRNVFEKVS